MFFKFSKNGPVFSIIISYTLPMFVINWCNECMLNFQSRLDLSPILCWIFHGFICDGNALCIYTLGALVTLLISCQFCVLKRYAVKLEYFVVKVNWASSFMLLLFVFLHPDQGVSMTDHNTRDLFLDVEDCAVNINVTSQNKFTVRTGKHATLSMKPID